MALDLIGPTLISAMVKKRAEMKVWPLVITCFSTGAVHLLVMHDYSTQAFLLQLEHFVALKGRPLSVRSDRGSQVLSGKNYVAWEPKEDPKNWKWDKIDEITARSGTF